MTWLPAQETLRDPKNAVGWDALSTGNMCRAQGLKLALAQATGAASGVFVTTIESASAALLLRAPDNCISADAVAMGHRVVAVELGTWLPTRPGELCQLVLALGGASARCETASCVTAHRALKLPVPEADENDDDFEPPSDDEGEEEDEDEEAAKTEAAAALAAETDADRFARHEEARVENAATLCKLARVSALAVMPRRALTAFPCCAGALGQLRRTPWR